MVWVKFKMDVIDTETVLVCILTTKSLVTVQDLNQYREDIEKKCNEDLYLDVTNSGIIGAIKSRPDLFESTPFSTIIRRGSEWYDNVKENFLFRIPSKYRYLF